MSCSACCQLNVYPQCGTTVLIGRDDGLVENSGDVLEGSSLAEPVDAAGQDPERRQAAHLGERSDDATMV